LAISVCSHSLVILGHPQEDEIEHKLALFNESMVSVYLYLLLSLTDYFPNPSRDASGWALLSVVFVSIVVNFLKFFYLIARDLIKHFR
jgi:hypothetical protein